MKTEVNQVHTNNKCNNFLIQMNIRQINSPYKLVVFHIENIDSSGYKFNDLYLIIIFY